MSSINFDENLLLTTPDVNLNLVPLTTQNYMDKYRELEGLYNAERKTCEQIKSFYKDLKAHHMK